MTVESLVDPNATRRSVRHALEGLVRYRALLHKLVLKDLKLKYRGSALGFVWSLANPLLMLTVYTLAFRYVLRIQTEGFVVALLVGLLAWMFFAHSMIMAAGSIADNGGLLKSVYFPRAVLPIASVLFNFMHYVVTMSVFLPLLVVIFRVPITWAALGLPVFVVLQVLFTVGLAFAVATGTAYFRDVRHLLDVALAALFWVTPVLYQMDQVPDALRLPVLLSPMSPFVAAYHEVLLKGAWPDPSLWALAGGYTAAALIVGFRLLVRFEEHFAELV